MNIKTIYRSVCMLSILITINSFLHAQYSVGSDTLNSKQTDSVWVNARWLAKQKSYLPEVSGTYIFSGKKSEIIQLNQSEVDISNKTARQIFSKIPGLFVYDMDGAGNQINIAARGLDAHRGWEFNLRKDGVLTNSDMYGYPASHFNMPLESIEKIELVRGTGSLQYGAQFGGMLNYVSKKADSTKPYSIESINSIGSYNLLSTFNSIGGNSGKWQYYAYFYKKSRDGYRDYDHTDAHAESVMLCYTPNSKLSINLQWSRSEYVYRMPGPLTDLMYAQNPRQATRTRNYFNPNIHIPSVNINYRISSATKLQIVSSAVLGKRNSVLYDKAANVPDTINPLTLQFNNRQVDIDNFNSYTTELRILQSYSFLKQVSLLSAGIQYMNNDLHRSQLGKGTTGTDFDLTQVQPGWGRDIHFKTKNIAFFAENKFQLTRVFSVTAGFRQEIGTSDLTGKITYYPDEKVPLTLHHNYPLFAAGFNYNLNEKNQLYGGWSQAYRSMVLKDLIPSSVYEKVNPDIKDANGYNAELGFRGNWKFLKWDVNVFLLKMNNRFGTFALADASGTYYTYRTNIGNSLNKGIEMYVEGNWMLTNNISVTAFTSTAFMHDRYVNAMFKLNNTNVDVSGNKVESAPDFTTRNSIVLRVHKLSAGLLYSYVSETYADALNTVTPPVSAATGLIPYYGLWDLNFAYRVSKSVEVKLSINNVGDKKYFTKRPMFYPGPGIWPSDGRSSFLSVRFKI